MTATAKPDAAETRTLSLVERLLLITAEIHVKATGKSPFSKEPAVSIEDIESAVRPLLVAHKVHIRFSSRGLKLIEKGTWLAKVVAVVSNVPVTPGGVFSAPSDIFTDDWEDTGGTPAAAYSFARKSYLKALFHIADATEETGSAVSSAADANGGARQPAGNGATLPPARVQKPRVTVQWTLLDRNCPDCGDGTLRVGVMPDGKSFIGCTNYPTCKHTEQVPREGSAALFAPGSGFEDAPLLEDGSR